MVPFSYALAIREVSLHSRRNGCEDLKKAPRTDWLIEEWSAGIEHFRTNQIMELGKVLLQKFQGIWCWHYTFSDQNGHDTNVRKSFCIERVRISKMSYLE